MTCIQGFIAAVPTKKRAAFIDHAAKAALALRDHGCLSAVECWGEEVPFGDLASFPSALQAGAEETVVFSWYIWPSKAARDAMMQGPIPFDGKRVIYGAFAPLVEYGTPQKGGYIDGFVIPVPTANREAFRRQATKFAPVFADFGASWIMECWEEDVPDCNVTDFRRVVQAKDSEAIVFSLVQWPDKQTRDTGSARMMQDDRFSELEIPFDGERMVFGGFVPVVQV